MISFWEFANANPVVAMLMVMTVSFFGYYAVEVMVKVPCLLVAHIWDDIVKWRANQKR